MKAIKKAGFVIKPHAPSVERILSDLISYFGAKGIGCVLEEAAAGKLGRTGGVPRGKVPEMSDLIIVLGGDGTLLSIAPLAAEKGIPVLGVNLGHLGFLTEVPLDEVYLTLDAYLEGDTAIVSSRQLLQAVHGNRIYGCLNDVVINKGAVARMIQLDIWIDGEKMAMLKSDGLIIATPTGSTAYALSAGGPIVQPNVPAIVVVPICPHTLTFRPMVISYDSRIRIELLTAGEEVYLTLDGQRGGVFQKNDVVEVRRSPHSLALVSSPKRNYIDLVKEKLGWGE